jgi:hypothetical protein
VFTQTARRRTSRADRSARAPPGRRRSPRAPRVRRGCPRRSRSGRELPHLAARGVDAAGEVEAGREVDAPVRMQAHDPAAQQQGERMPTRAALHFRASGPAAPWNRTAFLDSGSGRELRSATIGCSSASIRSACPPPKAVRARRVARAAGRARFVNYLAIVEPTWQGTGRWHTGALTPGS